MPEQKACKKFELSAVYGYLGRCGNCNQLRGDHDLTSTKSKSKKSDDNSSQSSSKSSTKDKKKKKKDKKENDDDSTTDKKKKKPVRKTSREIEVIKSTERPVFKTDKTPSWTTARGLLKTVPAPFSDAAMALLAERRAKPPSSDEEESVALTVNTSSSSSSRRRRLSSSTSPHSSRHHEPQDKLGPTYPTTSRPSVRRGSHESSTDDTRYVRAVFDFEGGQPGDLRLREGDIIQILGQIDANWWQGKCHGKTGIFPTAFVSKKQLRKRSKSRGGGRSRRSSSSLRRGSESQINTANVLANAAASAGRDRQPRDEAVDRWKSIKESTAVAGQERRRRLGSASAPVSPKSNGGHEPAPANPKLPAFLEVARQLKAKRLKAEREAAEKKALVAKRVEEELARKEQERREQEREDKLAAKAKQRAIDERVAHELEARRRASLVKKKEQDEQIRLELEKQQQRLVDQRVREAVARKRAIEAAQVRRHEADQERLRSEARRREEEEKNRREERARLQREADIQQRRVAETRRLRQEQLKKDQEEIEATVQLLVAQKAKDEELRVKEEAERFRMAEKAKLERYLDDDVKEKLRKLDVQEASRRKERELELEKRRRDEERRSRREAAEANRRRRREEQEREDVERLVQKEIAKREAKKLGIRYDSEESLLESHLSFTPTMKLAEVGTASSDPDSDNDSEQTGDVISAYTSATPGYGRRFSGQSDISSTSDTRRRYSEASSFYDDNMTVTSDYADTVTVYTDGRSDAGMSASTTDMSSGPGSPNMSNTSNKRSSQVRDVDVLLRWTDQKFDAKYHTSREFEDVITHVVAHAHNYQVADVIVLSVEAGSVKADVRVQAYSGSLDTTDAEVYQRELVAKLAAWDGYDLGRLTVESLSVKPCLSSKTYQPSASILAVRQRRKETKRTTSPPARPPAPKEPERPRVLKATPPPVPAKPVVPSGKTKDGKWAPVQATVPFGYVKPRDHVKPDLLKEASEALKPRMHMLTSGGASVPREIVNSSAPLKKKETEDTDSISSGKSSLMEELRQRQQQKKNESSSDNDKSDGSDAGSDSDKESEKSTDSDDDKEDEDSDKEEDSDSDDKSDGNTSGSDNERSRSGSTASSKSDGSSASKDDDKDSDAESNNSDANSDKASVTSSIASKDTTGPWSTADNNTKKNKKKEDSDSSGSDGDDASDDASSKKSSVSSKASSKADSDEENNRSEADKSEDSDEGSTGDDEDEDKGMKRSGSKKRGDSDTSSQNSSKSNRKSHKSHKSHKHGKHHKSGKHEKRGKHGKHGKHRHRGSSASSRSSRSSGSSRKSKNKSKKHRHHSDSDSEAEKEESEKSSSDTSANANGHKSDDSDGSDKTKDHKNDNSDDSDSEGSDKTKDRTSSVVSDQSDMSKSSAGLSSGSDDSGSQNRKKGKRGSESESNSDSDSSGDDAPPPPPPPLPPTQYDDDEDDDSFSGSGTEDYSDSQDSREKVVFKKKGRAQSEDSVSDDSDDSDDDSEASESEDSDSDSGREFNRKSNRRNNGGRHSDEVEGNGGNVVYSRKAKGEDDRWNYDSDGVENWEAETTDRRGKSNKVLSPTRKSNISTKRKSRMDNIWRAARRGDLDAVERFVKSGVDFNSPDMSNHDEDDDTWLGHTFLIASGETSGKTPLYWASVFGHGHVVMYLLDRGATDDGCAFNDTKQLEIRDMLAVAGFGAHGALDELSEEQLEAKQRLDARRAQMSRTHADADSNANARTNGQLNGREGHGNKAGTTPKSDVVAPACWWPFGGKKDGEKKQKRGRNFKKKSKDQRGKTRANSTDSGYYP